MGWAGQGRAGQGATMGSDRHNGLTSRNTRRKALVLPETFLLECWVVSFDPAPLGFPPRQQSFGLLPQKGGCGSFGL